MKGHLSSVTSGAIYRADSSERVLTVDVTVYGSNWKLELEHIDPKSVPSLGESVEIVERDGRLEFS